MTTRVIYAWVCDGVSTIFVTDEGLDDAWAVTQGFVRTHAGLRAPSGLPAVIDLRELVPERTSARLEVHDVDDTLAALFAPAWNNYDPLIETVLAGDVAPAATWGKSVNMEAIGPAGERRRYSCEPGHNIGFKHLGQNEALAVGAGDTKVSTGPRLWEGRLCTVWRVTYDEALGRWKNLSELDKIWWGSLRGNGEQHMKRWSFSCFGPESWIGGNLGKGRFEEPLRCIPLFSLEDNGFAGETVFRGDLWTLRIDDFNTIAETYVDRTSDAIGTDTSYLVGATTYAEVAVALNLFLDDLVAHTDVDTPDAFNDAGNDVFFATSDGGDGVVVKWTRAADPNVDAGNDPTQFVALARIMAHEKVWRALGYDVRLQNSDRDPVSNADQYGQFVESAFGGGYWEGFFFSASPQGMKLYEDNGPFDQWKTELAEAAGRRWPPLYPGGAVAFSAETGQEFQLAASEAVLLAGTYSRPLMAAPGDNTTPRTIGGGIGAVTAQALLVLQGPYRRRGDEDTVDPVAGFAFELERERREGRTVQVVRVCWRESADGSIATDSDGWPRLVVSEWYDPRLFGFDFTRFSGTWGSFRKPPPGAEGITALPLVAWEYTSEAERTMSVLRRILLTTGTTTGWYTDNTYTTAAYGDAPAVLEPGDNDDGGAVVGDSEEAYLGLGIPASMAAGPEAFDLAASLAGEHLSRCKASATKAISAMELIKRLLAPMGVALGYKGGKFTPFDPWRFPTPGEAAIVITQESYGGKAGSTALVPRQGLRKHQAIDRILVNARIEPVSGGHERTITKHSTDAGGVARRQRVTHAINGDHLVSAKLPIDGNSWESDLGVRWRAGFAFWAAPHTTVPLTLHMDEGLDVWPGDGVLYTDPWCLNSAGEYGTAIAVGLVLARRANPKKESITFEVMLSAESDFRMYAPSAVAFRYDENDEALGYRLLCQDDHFGDRRGLARDVDGFIEPSWSSEGGDADLEIFQFDGVTWTRGIFGVAESVNSADGDSWIKLTGALTGNTYYRDMHHVVLFSTFAAQGAAWVKRWHAPICESDGTHSGGQPGVKFRGV